MAESDAGNVAAMREALEKIKKLNRYDLGCIRSRKRRDEFDSRILEIERTVRAALAKPARNCDVGTADEQYKRFRDMCDSKDALQCSYCELRGLNGLNCSRDKCLARWSQLPYEEGGDKR